MTRLEAGIAEALARMSWADRELARRAKSEGWPVVARGRYTERGAEVVRVRVPAGVDAFKPGEHEADVRAEAWDALR